MIRFAPKRIFCPVDFSGQSATALRVAGGLAQIFGAGVTVLHAQRLEAPAYFTVAETQALKSQLRRSLRAARKLLNDFATDHLPENVERTILLVERNPVSAILAAYEQSGSDLLVMGTHGRTGLTRIRLGSVMESVCRQITGPLVTVSPRVKLTARMGKIRRVLCPVDFGEPAREVFAYAADVAANAGAELIAAHILEHPAKGYRRQMQEALCDWVPPEARSRCVVHEVVREGSLAESILAEAASSRADLIVQAAKPRSYWGNLFFGSTTEAVLRSAPCPVLSIIRGRA